MNLELQGSCLILFAACRARGADMQISSAIRGPGSQARIWCQSRSETEIAAAKAGMVASGAPWLASLLRYDTGRRGPEVTRALPGASWHQWGEAIDCFVRIDGKPAKDGGNPGYRIYAEEAVKVGLDAGLFWPNFPDAGHIQLRKQSSPTKARISWPQIESQMKSRYGA